MTDHFATVEELEAFLETEGEYLKFENIEDPSSKRPDLHAFLLLDRLLPDNKDIVSCAEHDQFWLSVDIDKLLKVATRAQWKDLHRCGVMVDEESLYMWA